MPSAHASGLNLTADKPIGITTLGLVGIDRRQLQEKNKSGTLTQSVPLFMRSILASGPQGELHLAEQQPFFV
jgi:hypothetical protein